MVKFVGRKQELSDLNGLLKKKSASLVVIRGRRRVGKSRLIQEFAKGKESWVFSGLPPERKVNRQEQIDAFTERMALYLKSPKIQAERWDQVFWHLGEHTQNQRLVLVLDEISWMGSKDATFLGHLKNAWDLYFSKNPRLIVILCGSVSNWIEKNILSSTGFFGRVSLSLELKELSLKECQEFWGAQQKRISAYEKFKVLSITGGIPRYLEEIKPEESAEKNIQELCFRKQGVLYEEYDRIFSDLFSRKAKTYGNVVSLLAQGPIDLSEICKKLGIEKSGAISKYLRDLMLTGFVSESSTWDLKTQKSSLLKQFYLCDNYLRFYLRYIKPNKEKIARGSFRFRSLSNLPEWETILGLQFENLVLHNLKDLCEALGIDLHDVAMAGPFFQRANKRQKGCQIDLLIQTNYHTLYVCEIKFRGGEVGPQVIEEVEEKIERLAVPKRMSIRPVLIHVNGMSRQVKEREFFSKIVDFSDLLRGS